MKPQTTDRNEMFRLGVSPDDAKNVRSLDIIPSHFHPLGGALWVAEHLGQDVFGVSVGVNGARFIAGTHPTYDEAMEAWKSSSSN